MQSSVYLILALVAFSAGKQLDSGPKVSQEASQSSDVSKGQNKRYATKEIILYLTPSEIKELQGARNVESKESPAENQKEEQQQLSLQNYNDEQQQRAWSQYFKSLQIEVPNEEWQNAYYSQSKPVFENQGDSAIGAYRFEQNIQQQQQQNIKEQEERNRQESEWVAFKNAAAAKKQDEELLQNQLQEHWNRLLNHNRAQLRGLSAINKEQRSSESSSESEKPAERWQAASKIQENKKSDIEKQIEIILQEASELEKQSIRNEASHINHRPPVVIQKEIRVIKHHPVPIVEKVKVPVHRPVLVPVPEPYEVKVPHPYPVPFEVVKHIPVPVVLNN